MAISHGYRRSNNLRPTARFAADAQQLVAIGKAAEAVELCKRGLVYYPENVTGYIILSQAYLERRQKDRALNVLRDGHRRTGSPQLEQIRMQIEGNGEGQPAPAFQREQAIVNGAAKVAFEYVVEQEIEEAEQPAPTAEMAEIGEQEIVEAAVPPSPAVEKNVPAEETISAQEAATGTESLTDRDETEQAEEVASSAPVLVIHEEWIAETIITEVLPEAAPADAAVPVTAPAEPPSAEEEPKVVDPAAHEMPATVSEDGSHPEFQEQPPAINALAPDLQADVAEERSEPVVSVTTATPHRPDQSEPVAEPEPRPLESIPEEEYQPEPLHAEGRQEPVAETTKHSLTPEAIAPEPGEAHDYPPADQNRYLSLAIHAGKNIARLRSSNLRLIPGLEFAPLRSGDQGHRQPIAPLINEPLPQLKFPERVPSRAAVPPDWIASETGPIDTRTIRESARAYDAAPPRGSHDRGMAAQMRRDIPGVEGRGTESAGPSLPLPERLHEEHPGTVQRKRRPAARPYTTPGLTPLTVSGGDMPAAHDKPAEELTPLEELARRLEHARIPVIEEEEIPSAYESSIVSETLANILVAQGKYAEALKAFQTLARMKPERYDYLQGRIVEMKWRLQNPGESWPPAPPEEEIEEEEDDLLDEEMEYPEDAEEEEDEDYLE